MHHDLVAAERAMRNNDLAKAEAHVRACLKSEPDNVEALRLLADIAAAAGFEEDAERLLRNAICLAPAFARAYADLTSLMCRIGRAAEAISLLDLAIARNPDAIWPLSLKAAVLDAERRTDESLALHEELVVRAGNISVPWFNYGHALAAMGRVDEAIIAYRKALCIEPGNGSAWLGLANLRTVELEANDIDLLQRAISEPSELPQRAQLHFALGKALNDHGKFEQSFQQYKKGNELRQSMVPYHPSATSKLVRRVQEVLNARFVAERAESGCKAPDPIFIVGMPRSGSTLIEQILASHSMVEGCGELFELQNLVAQLVGRGAPQDMWPERLAALDTDAMHALGRHYLDSVRRHRKTDRPFFVDKMPSNWRFLGLIHLILPGARIIDVRRDPMACCFSAFTTYFSRETSFPTNLKDLGHYHADYIRMAGHFDELVPGKLHRVRYERVVADLEGGVRRLLEYLNLPFEPACLHFHENARAVHTPSAQQVRRPIDTSGTDRWRDFAPWLAPLQKILDTPSRPASP